MPQSPTQRRAADAVAAWLAKHHKNPAWLVEAAKADPGTIGDFLNGKRWPKTGTQGRIEDALGWPSGTIRQIGNGADVPDTLLDDLEPTVGGVVQDAGYVAAPGAVTEGGVTNEDLLRAIISVRAEYDQLRAGQQELLQRVEKLEQRST